MDCNVDYPQTFSKEPGLFYKSLLALSDTSLSNEGDNKDHPYVTSRYRTKREVRLLNGIAMLFQGTGPACATTLIQGNSLTTIYWTKTCVAKPTTNEQRYVENLLSAFQKRVPWSRVLKLCVRQCFPQVLSRFLDASKLFHWSPNNRTTLRVKKTSSYYRKFQKRVRKISEFSTATVDAALDWFVEHLSRVNENSTADELYQIVRVAYLITPKPKAIAEELTRSPIFSDEQLHQVKKLIAYPRIIRDVFEVCKKYGITDLREQYVRSSFIQPIV